MAKPPINVRSSGLTLPTPISIDGADDGSNIFLDAMRCNFKDAKQHLSALKAFENVVGSPEGTLIGHGQPGLILAGRGIDFDFRTNPDQTRSISIDNIDGKDGWKALVTQMRTPVTSLMLFGCQVGAETDGAELLWQLAKALGSTVTAPVGLVWPDTATLDPCVAADEPFQTADATMTSRPPAKPARRLSPPGPADRLQLWDGSRFLTVSIEAVRGARHRSSRQRTDGWSAEWSAPGAQTLARQVAFDRPLVFPGPPATIVTGRVFLSYRFLGQDMTRQFFVHNDRLLQDASAPDVFYEMDAPSILAA